MTGCFHKERTDMNPKRTLELKFIGEPARGGGITDPEAMHKSGQKLKRRQRRRLFKNAWARRLRRPSAAAPCTANALLLSSSEEKELAERIKAGDKDSEQKLITANLGLVKNAVNDYAHCGVPEDDLIQEGNMGLIRAARHFDSSKHTTRFATYATYWIRCFMVRALASNRSLIQRPTKLNLLRVQYSRAVHELQALRAATTGEPSPMSPSLDEIARYLGVAPGRLEHMRRTGAEEAICQDLGELTLADDPTPDVNVVKNEDRILVCAALRSLSPFEAWVICERYGLGEPSLRETRLAGHRTLATAAVDKPPTRSGSLDDTQGAGRQPGESYFQRSYIDMGRDCGLSVFRLHQVEKTALDKLRRALAGRAPSGK